MTEQQEEEQTTDLNVNHIFKYDRGIKELTSVRLTDRHVLGGEYMISHYNYRENAFCKGHEKLLFEILSYKTNATCPDVGLIAISTLSPVSTPSL